MPAILPGESGTAPEGGGLGLLGCVARLREALDGGLRAPAPDSASPLRAAAARAPPPDGSRRFTIAPPGGSARRGRGAGQRRPPAARPVERGRLLPPLAGPAPSATRSSGRWGVGPNPCPVLWPRPYAFRRGRADWLGRGRRSSTSQHLPRGGEQEAGGQARPYQRPSQRSLWTVSSHCWLCCRLDPVGGGPSPHSTLEETVARTGPGPG